MSETKVDSPAQGLLAFGLIGALIAGAEGAILGSIIGLIIGTWASKK